MWNVIRKQFDRLTLTKKLMAIAVVTTVVALQIAAVMFLLYDVASARTRLVIDTVMLAESIARNSSAAITFDDREVAIEATIVGDPVRLRQVISNLVSNAIKFTERGQVRLRLREEKRLNGETRLAFDVSDTGIGIPEDKQASIFEAFSQADGSITRKYGGSGLGLTISTMLVRMMGARLAVESRVGAGSRFFFTAQFPLAAAPQELTAPRPPVPVRVRHVLLTEDNIVNQRVAAGLLAKRGHHVTIAANGAEALAALQREAFDVVLMDIQMPVMGGFEATERIRARDGANGVHTRVIAMTAHAMAGDRERCLAAGMDGYISKPIDRTALLGAVEDEGAADLAPDDDTHQRGEAAPLDRAALLARVAGDEHVGQQVLELFREDCDVRLAAVRDAVSSLDAARIKSAAHALKGAAANISAHPLSDAARALEQIGFEGRLGEAAAAARRIEHEAAKLMDVLVQEQVPCLR